VFRAGRRQLPTERLEETGHHQKGGHASQTISFALRAFMQIEEPGFLNRPSV